MWSDCRLGTTAQQMHTYSCQSPADTLGHPSQLLLPIAADTEGHPSQCSQNCWALKQTGKVQGFILTFLSYQQLFLRI